jgi:hypothetical protein
MTPRPSPPLARRSLLLGLFAAALAAPARAAAALVPRPLDLGYALTYAGVRVADLQLTIKPDGAGTATVFMMRTRGLAALASGAWTRFSGNAELAHGEVVPRAFEATYFKRDRVREIRIRYDGSGEIAALALTNNGRDQDSRVPEPLQADTVDPLTALHRLRLWLPQAAQGAAPDRLLVPVFEGRKRFDIDVSYAGPAAWRDGRRDRPAHLLRVLLVARHGFDEEDAFFTLPGRTEERWLRVVASADERALPVSVVAEAGGSSRIELVSG